MEAGTISGSRPGRVVVVCTVAYGALGWMLNGLGSILPPLRDQVGGVAGLYPLVPGVAMLVSAIAIASRRDDDGHDAGGADRTGSVIVAFVGLAVTMVLLAVTEPTAVSVAGMVGAAVCAAALARLVPGVLASIDPPRTTHLLMRANGVSSAAGVVAPLAVGAAIAIGAGWRVGFVGPVVIAALAVAASHRMTTTGPMLAPATAGERGSRAEVTDLERPVSTGRSWIPPAVVLTLCIVVEFCFTYFATTYLSEELGLSNAVAAAGGAAWGIGMATGRFLLDAHRSTSIGPRLVLIAVGFVALWVIATPVLAITGFAVAGFGAAPLYPSRLAVLMGRFPRSPHQGATYGLLCSGVALVAAPALMAGLRAGFDVRTAYLAVPLLLVVLAVVAFVDERR